MTGLRAIRLCAWLAAAVGCGFFSEPEVQDLPELTPLCRDQGLGPDEFCLPVERLAVMARPESAEILAVRVAPHGFTRPRHVTVEFTSEKPRERIVVEAKWKPAPRGGEGLNNQPRKELAAYAIQQWFLDPDAYVVAPTFGVCIPLETYRQSLSDAEPTFDGARCVFGIAAYWLQNITSKGVWDPERFERDLAYRTSFANLNLLTYLIDHRDGRPSNFARSTDPSRPRVFSLDNGLSFSGFTGVSTWVGINPDWSELRVSALPKRSIERLRALEPEQIAGLAVVVQYRMHENGFAPVEPGPPLDDPDGVRVSGTTVQLGLEGHEIEGVEQRVRRLLERVDSGELTLF